jgi:hypothetical protein
LRETRQEDREPDDALPGGEKRSAVRGQAEKFEGSKEDAITVRINPKLQDR